MNNWYVITGGPSTGKTTLLNILEGRGYKVIHEAARIVIDGDLAKGLTLEKIRANEKQFQERVLKRKLDIELSLDKSLTTFFDRGIHDTLAYMHFYGWKIGQEIDELIKKPIYKKVFLLEPLPSFISDYARTEDQNFTIKITDLLRKAYQDSGHVVVMVPAGGVEERVKFIIEKIKN